MSRQRGAVDADPWARGRGRWRDTAARIRSAGAWTSVPIHQGVWKDGRWIVGGLAWSGNGWPNRLFSAASVLAKLTPICVDGFGLCDGPAPEVVMVGDSHAGHYALPIAEALKAAKIRGKLYPTEEGCYLLSGAYAAHRFDSASPCPDLQREWAERLKADNPKAVILASFWENGIGNGFGGRLTDRTQSRGLEVSEARELFERKINETIQQLTAQGRNVVLLGNGPIVERDPSSCYSRPIYLGKPDCSKLNVQTDPGAHTFVRGVLAKIAATYPNVFFFDAYPQLCEGTRCPLGEGNTSFYNDRHHLSNYGGLWMQRHAFGPLTQFLRDAAAANRRSHASSEGLN